MKRIEPVSEHREPDYPTACEAGVNRRGFMRVVVASSVAAVGGVIVGNDVAHARGVIARPRYRVAIDLKPPYVYKGCKSAIVQIIARTYGHRTHAFLANKNERKGVLGAIRGALNKHKCADLTGSGRYKVQSAIGYALAAHYKKRTGISASYPRCTLVLKPVKK